MEQIVTLLLFALAGGGFLAAAHFAFKENEIGPPWTYVIGVGTIQGILVSWLLYIRANPLIIGGVIVITVVIGGAILLCYLIDKAKQADRARPDVTRQRSDGD